MLCNWGPWGSCNQIAVEQKQEREYGGSFWNCKGGGDVETDLWTTMPDVNVSWGDCIGPCGGTEKTRTRIWGSWL